MYKSIQNVIDNEFKYVKIDNNFNNKLLKFINDWKYKAIHNDNSEFLGSNLLGVYSFSFSKYDDDIFFKTILRSSESKMKYAFHNTEGINPQFKVSSNPMYLTLVTLMHMTYNTKLSDKVKQEIVTRLALIMGYKCFGSMYNHFFKIPADIGTAKAAYENLNDKYLIKKYGSWQAVFEYRTLDVLPKGIFYDKIIDYSSENAVYVINGIQGSYKSMLINLFKVYLETRDRNEKITSTSLVGKIGNVDEEESILEDVTTGEVRYINYVKSRISVDTDFINSDMVYLVTKVIPRCKIEHFNELLSELSKMEYPKDKDKDFIEKIIVSSFAYLRNKGITSNFNRNANRCLNYLKGYWMAGNIKDPTAREAKAMANELVTTFGSSYDRTLIPSIAIGLLLYIFLIAISGFKD